MKDKTDKARKEKLIAKFFDQQCIRQLTEIVNSIYPIFEKYKVDFPTLKFKTMKTRWGSCTPQKEIISLNKRLIQMPKPCIEYVVLHEFCHFIHPNHSKQFYALVATLMPDWKERKAVLESMN